MGAAVSGSPLSGKTVYFPAMSEAGVRVIAAAFRSVGIDAKSMPPSDEETMVLGGAAPPARSAFHSRSRWGTP